MFQTPRAIAVAWVLCAGVGTAYPVIEGQGISRRNAGAVLALKRGRSSSPLAGRHTHTLDTEQHNALHPLRLPPCCLTVTARPPHARPPGRVPWRAAVSAGAVQQTGVATGALTCISLCF